MSDRIDLYGASLELYFKTKNGTPKTMRNIIFGETTSVHDVSYCNFVSHVKVKISVVRMTNIEITLTPPFDEAVTLIDSGVIGLGFSKNSASGEKTGDLDADLASPSGTSFDFNTVIVKLFYGGKESPYFKGVLLPPEFQINTDGISITLKAVGMLFQQSKVTMRQSFEDIDRFTILQQALGDDVELSVSPGDAKANEALAKLEKLNANESNTSVIRKILDKSDCVMLDRGVGGPSGTPVFEVMSKDHMRTKRDTAAVFVLWSQIDPNNGVYPITNMDTTINNVLLGQSLGINTMSVNKSTKEISNVQDENMSTNPHPSANKLSSPDGSTALGSADKSLTKQVKHFNILNFGEEHTAKDAVQNILSAAVDRTLNYKLETLGILDLLPGRTVTVKVAGVKFLSGAYDLYEVEHELGTEGVATRLTLARTAGLAKLIDKAVDSVQGAALAVKANTTFSSGRGLIP